MVRFIGAGLGDCPGKLLKIIDDLSDLEECRGQKERISE